MCARRGGRRSGRIEDMGGDIRRERVSMGAACRAWQKRVVAKMFHRAQEPGRATHAFLNTGHKNL